MLYLPVLPSVPITDVQLHLSLYTAVSSKETLEIFGCVELHSHKLNLLKIICGAKP